MSNKNLPSYKELMKKNTELLEEIDSIERELSDMEFERDEALKKVQEVTNELKDVKVQLEMAMSEAKKNDTAGKDEMKLITDQLTLKDQEKIKLEKKIEAKDQECVLAIERRGEPERFLCGCSAACCNTLGQAVNFQARGVEHLHGDI